MEDCLDAHFYTDDSLVHSMANAPFYEKSRPVDLPLNRNGGRSIKNQSNLHMTYSTEDGHIMTNTTNIDSPPLDFLKLTSPDLERIFLNLHDSETNSPSSTNQDMLLPMATDGPTENMFTDALQQLHNRQEGINTCKAVGKQQHQHKQNNPNQQQHIQRLQDQYQQCIIMRNGQVDGLLLDNDSNNNNNGNINNDDRRNNNNNNNKTSRDIKLHQKSDYKSMTNISNSNSNVISTLTNSNLVHEAHQVSNMAEIPIQAQNVSLICGPIGLVEPVQTIGQNQRLQSQTDPFGLAGLELLDPQNQQRRNIPLVQQLVENQQCAQFQSNAICYQKDREQHSSHVSEFSMQEQAHQNQRQLIGAQFQTLQAKFLESAYSDQSFHQNGNMSGMEPMQVAQIPQDQSRMFMDNNNQHVQPINLEIQELVKRERKKLRNRIASSKCRKRKLEREAKLEDRVKDLKEKNIELGAVANALKQQVCDLKQKVMDHVSEGCQIVLPSK